MSGYDPNDPNNPWGNQGWNNQQGGQQPNQQQQQWDQQQQQWGQQGQQGQQGQWNQQPQWNQQQQGGWDQQQQQQWNQQQAQQQWDQQQQQQQWDQQQQWNQQQQAQQGWDQQQQQWNQQPAAAQQSWEQQQNQWSNVAGYAGGAAAATADVADDSSVGSVKSDGRSIQGAVATLGSDVRVSFIKKTYAHLAGAILLFLGLEYAAFAIPVVEQKFSNPFLFWALSGYNWGIVLAGFMAVSWIADKWAMNASSRGMQYIGLLLYTVAEAVTFVPLINLAMRIDPMIPTQGFVITVALFAGLTAVVFVTRKDFSFLRGALALGSMIALGMIVAAIMFGFSLGIVFSAAICALAGGYILYYTSRVLAHYHPQQYVSAALALFSAFMLLLWYVIRILMELRR